MAHAARWPAPANFPILVPYGSAYIKWDAVPGVSGYDLFRKLPGESGFRAIATNLYTPYFTDANVPLGRNEYIVQAVNGEPTPPTPGWAGQPTPPQAFVTQGKPNFKLGWDGIYAGG